MAMRAWQKAGVVVALVGARESLCKATDAAHGDDELFGLAFDLKQDTDRLIAKVVGDTPDPEEGPTDQAWAEAIAARIADESSYDADDKKILESVLAVALEHTPRAMRKLIGTGIIEESYFEKE